MISAKSFPISTNNKPVYLFSKGRQSFYGCDLSQIPDNSANSNINNLESEIRLSPAGYYPVIIAPKKHINKVKSNFIGTGLGYSENCDFCPGNESRTNYDTLSLQSRGKSTNMPSWKIRVFRSKFSPFSESAKTYNVIGEGIRKKGSASGINEIIVETPDHDKEIHTRSVNDIAELIGVYKQRSIELASSPTIKHIFIFKNRGVKAGGSMIHSHSQIYAFPFIPPTIKKELSDGLEYYKKNGRCVYQDIIEDQLKNKVGLISENKDFISFVPYNARRPYEINILPKFNSANFEKITPEQTRNLAMILKAAFAKLEKVIPDISYNYFIHTAPVKCKSADKYYRWHVEILPREVNVGSSELGAGVFINTRNPEDTAKELREAR